MASCTNHTMVRDYESYERINAEANRVALLEKRVLQALAV